MAPETLPDTHRALLLTSKDEGPKLATLPLPTLTPGSAIIRIAIAGVLPYSRAVYNGTRPNYSLPTPLVIGSSALGHVAAVSRDATTLQPGQLVLVDSFLRARDNPDISCLLGLHAGHTPASQSLMAGEWRDATYAQYAKVPLENCHVLNETRLVSPPASGGLGYDLTALAGMPRLAVPVGGLADIGLRAGETIIIAPATGSFGGAAVTVALALGANVIAAGRNGDALARLTSRHGHTGRIHTVRLMGDVNADTALLTSTPLGPMIDAYQDWSPPTAARTASHMTSCMNALRVHGRVSLMGGIGEDIPINYGRVMHWNLQIRGRWMYERKDVAMLIHMVEGGVLELADRKRGDRNGDGDGDVHVFGLEEWEKAFMVAEEVGSNGSVAIRP